MCVDACASGRVSTAYPPLPLLNFCFCTSSRGRRKKRQAVVHCLPDRDLVGFLRSAETGKEQKTHTTELVVVRGGGGLISTERPQVP